MLILFSLSDENIFSDFSIFSKMFIEQLMWVPCAHRLTLTDYLLYARIQDFTEQDNPLEQELYIPLFYKGKNEAQRG